MLGRAQRTSGVRDLWLSKRALLHLSEVLLDFAEDVGDAHGLWSAYESCNLELFGARLPLTTAPTEPGVAGHRARIQHLLWILYPAFDPDLVLDPNHAHLATMAASAEEFLQDALAAGPPAGSAVREALGGSNERYAEVKEKLIWLGTHSYLFRAMRAAHVEQAEGSMAFEEWDRFLCEVPTAWSGLGVVDLLAALLEPPEQDRAALREWRTRHASLFRIRALDAGVMRVENVFGGREYRVPLEGESAAFGPGQVVFGNLVPWRGAWYWSGGQRLCGDVSDRVLDELREELMAKSSQLVCRSWPEHEAKVREHAARLHESALSYHGGDLKHYPDGLSFAADFQRELRTLWECRSPADREAMARRHGLDRDRPEVSLPDHVLEHDEGVGVFLNPAEGKEIMLGFTTLLAGLRRRGEGLTETEGATIRAFLLSESVSPQFVRRLVSEHGADSIRAAFYLREEPPAYWLDYLLRKHKGHFYGRRFPTVSVVS